jgi:hypothetical protein
LANGTYSSLHTLCIGNNFTFLLTLHNYETSRHAYRVTDENKGVRNGNRKTFSAFINLNINIRLPWWCSGYCDVHWNQRLRVLNPTKASTPSTRIGSKVVVRSGVSFSRSRLITRSYSPLHSPPVAGLITRIGQ